MDMNEIVCNCMNVTVGEIKEAIDKGAKSFDEVQAATNVSAGCGGCKGKAEAIIAELLA